MPSADGDRCSNGMYWKSLRRCFGERTGGWYCHTYKRDPVLRELIISDLGIFEQIGGVQEK
jgi:hypothetical protein